LQLFAFSQIVAISSHVAIATKLTLVFKYALVKNCHLLVAPSPHAAHFSDVL